MTLMCPNERSVRLNIPVVVIQTRGRLELSNFTEVFIGG
jgi:hypothetical protein